MKRRLVILTEIIAPYRIPLFNTLAGHPGVELHVIFLSETDPNLRQWKVYKEEIQFSYQVLPSWRKRIGRHNALLNLGVGRALAGVAPDAIVCGGYNYSASWQALLWARSHDVPFFLWSESNLQDARRGHALVEFLKAEFYRKCSGFVVPGKSAREYVLSRRVKEDRIFTAPNAVDNAFFAAAAAAARCDPIAHRRELNLPNRYILFAGRLVPEKGVFDLLSAYAKLEYRVREQVGLVFVGDGVSRAQLENQAAAVSPGVIRFAGFAHREQLANYYALAEMLILPTHSDPWGLVVNEAMACGLAVITSQVAGCAADLVREGWNGLQVPTKDVSSLAGALYCLAIQPTLCATMGAHSRQHISHYSADEWTKGIVLAIGASGGTGD